MLIKHWTKAKENHFSLNKCQLQKGLEQIKGGVALQRGGKAMCTFAFTLKESRKSWKSSIQDQKMTLLRCDPNQVHWKHREFTTSSKCMNKNGMAPRLV